MYIQFVEIFRTMILPVVMYECGTRGLALRRENLDWGCLRTGILGEHLDLTGSNSSEIPLVNEYFFKTF
jgi:hypothetical protein